MTDVSKLIDEVITREGGYVNHPADRGGPTCWGITEAVARANGYQGPMRNLPREQAAQIYRKLYWLDTGINMGVGTAAGFLQRALNALNRQGRDYADLTVDRAIGPRTLAALDGFLKTRGMAGEIVLLRAVEALQGERYIALAEKNPSQEAFLYGWLANRIGNAS